MPDRKVLKGIKPFNRFLFRSCYYHQLIAAYARYGIDEKLLLMNYVPLYDKKNFQTYDGLTVFTEKELEEISGVRLVKKKTVVDVTERTIASVERGSPVIVAVDCFYLTYREDTYKKKHLPHFLLVYGYDRPKKKLIVNEHSYVNSVYYTEREIAFGELKTAYAGYMKRLNKGGTGIVEIKRVARRAYEFSRWQYVKAYYDNRIRITESVDNLTGLCGHIISILPNKEKLDSELKKLTGDFVFIRFKKNVQRYQMAALFNDEQINAMNYRCMDDLIFVYGLLAKIGMTDCYSERNAEKIAARLKEVVEIETELHGILLGKHDEIFC